MTTLKRSIFSRKQAQTFAAVIKARDTAYTKAVDSLARYKFEMFGYWASAWVKYNQLLPVGHKRGNPFIGLVKHARLIRDDDAAAQIKEGGPQ